MSATLTIGWDSKKYFLMSSTNDFTRRIERFVAQVQLLFIPDGCRCKYAYRISLCCKCCMRLSAVCAKSCFQFAAVSRKGYESSDKICERTANENF